MDPASLVKRERRLDNECRHLARVVEANPGRLSGLKVSRSGPFVDGLELTARVRTAVRRRGAVPEALRLSVRVRIDLALTYPRKPPRVMVESSEPLFLGGVIELPGPGGRWRGGACTRRDYDPEGPTLVPTLLAAWNTLTGRGYNSVRDSLHPEAAAYWLSRTAELPLDEPLVVPADVGAEPAFDGGRGGGDFELREVSS